MVLLLLTCFLLLLPLWESVIVLCFVVRYFISMFCCILLYAHSSDAIILMGKRDMVAFLVSHDCDVALPHGVMGFSAFSDCGIS